MTFTHASKRVDGSKTARSGPDKQYKVEEINLMPAATSRLEANGKIYSGDYLMKVGLNVFGFIHTQSHVVETDCPMISIYLKL